MEIEEKLNEFMEIAYSSIEETMYYPTVVNNIHDILKTLCVLVLNLIILLK